MMWVPPTTLRLDGIGRLWFENLSEEVKWSYRDDIGHIPIITRNDEIILNDLLVATAVYFGIPLIYVYNRDAPPFISAADFPGH
jgi:hypothetical protein